MVPTQLGVVAILLGILWGMRSGLWKRAFKATSSGFAITLTILYGQIDMRFASQNRKPVRDVALILAGLKVLPEYGSYPACGKRPLPRTPGTMLV